MSDLALAVEAREGSGKGVARKLRAAGRIPAVVYGQGRDSIKLTLDPAALEKLLKAHGHNALIALTGAESVSGRTVLVKELQRDPVQGWPVHADFFEIDVKQTITVSIPVHLIGTPQGVSLEGGLLDHVLREVEIDCLPGAIPEFIDVDVEGLAVGDSVHVEELTLPEGVSMKTSGDLSVASVVAPAAEEVEVAPEEPEVEGEEAPVPSDDADAAAPSSD